MCCIKEFCKYFKLNRFVLLKKRNGANGKGGRGAANGNRGGRGGRGRGAPRGGGAANGSGSYNVCRYCKKPGHLQKVCNARILKADSRQSELPPTVQIEEINNIRVIMVRSIL